MITQIRPLTITDNKTFTVSFSDMSKKQQNTTDVILAQ